MAGGALVIYDHEVLVDVLVHHQRTSSRGCHCGWDVLGASHPEHVADAYEQAVAGRRVADLLRQDVFDHPYGHPCRRCAALWRDHPTPACQEWL
jgi:hypothetical protein